MLQSTQSVGTQSPHGSFRRNIRNHSTPLATNGANSSNRLSNSNKRRLRKRKLNDSSNDVIDLTPKKFKVPSNHAADDSDVEIIEPEPPTIIDLVADDTTYNCNATVVSATVVTPTVNIATSDSQEKENTISNDTTNVIVDSSASTEAVDTSIEALKEIETETPQSNIEPVPLFVIDKDVSGISNSSLKPPLYDLVSDDSFCFDSPHATPVSSQEFSLSRTLTNHADDSVVFVSETIQMPKRGVTVHTPKRASRAEDFIPINHRGGMTRFQQNNKRSPKGQVHKQRSPRNNQLRYVNPVTATQTQTSAEPKPISGIKRMVLIDGNNVAFGHSRNRDFSVEGINICLNYFIEKGYDAKAIVPQMRLKKTRSSNQDLLGKLESEGKVVFSPCKNLPNGKKVTSYDDRFILDFAVECDAAVISNDNYRDLSKEKEEYRDIINTRVIGFTFLNDIIRFPKDPYGKDGPTLDDILNGKEKK